MMTPEETYELLKKDVKRAQDLNIPLYPFTVKAVRALLAGYKALQPRLLTLREVQCYRDCPIIWTEVKNREPSNADWMNVSHIRNYWAHPDSGQSKNYEILWRCWSARPTPEQSSSTPWGRGPRRAD